MKLKYYGTAAAEGFPAIFCKCDRCIEALRLGGKNIRTRSQACIDDKILIDFNEDTYLHMVRYGLDLRYINNVLITHKHEDHLYKFDFGNLREGFSHPPQGQLEPMRVYSSEKSIAPLKEYVENLKINRIETVAVKEFESFEAEGYKITAFPANHDYAACGSVFYSVEREGKNILYANDTGFFPDSVWVFFEREKPYYNIVSLDCTSMLNDEAYNWHMGLKTCIMVKEKMLSIGVCDEKTKFVLNHFSHNSTPLFDECERLGTENGFLVSFDTMEIEA